MFKKTVSLFIVALVAMMSAAPMAMAESGSESSDPLVLAAIMIGSGLAIGLAALGTGIGMGGAIRGATEGVARNPGVSGKILTTMMVGLAMIESLAIYALLIAIILLFVNPYM